MPIAGDQFELNSSAKTAGNIAMADVQLIKGAFKYYATAAEMNALDPALFSTGQIVWVEDSGSLYKATVTLADYITVFEDSVSFAPFTFPSSGSGGGGTPASPSNSIQFNNGGSFGGSSNFLFNNSTSAAQISGSLELNANTSNDIFLIKSGSTSIAKVDTAGNFILVERTSTPTAVEGGIMYSSSAFYVGIE